MRCRKVRSFLSTFSKGEASAGLMPKIEEHLKGCPSCRREEEIVNSVNKLVKASPRLETSDDFNTRLLNRIAHERFSETRTKAYMPGRIPRFGTFRLVSVAATAAIVMVFAFSLDFTGTLKSIGSPEMAISAGSTDNPAEDDLYMTVQPTDNPFLNERKTVSQVVQQYNRWRNYSKSLRAHSAAEKFSSGGGGMLLTSAQASPVSTNVRFRPVVKSYPIVPANQVTTNGRATY